MPAGVPGPVGASRAGTNSSSWTEAQWPSACCNGSRLSLNNVSPASCVPAQGDLAFLFTVSASDKQWNKSKDTLKQIVTSFSV